jgi:hypothetical protein
LHLTDGSRVPVNLSLRDRHPLTFAAAPGDPSSFFVLKDPSPPAPFLTRVNESDVQGEAGMGTDDPGWSTKEGLVSTPDGSMVAYLTTDDASNDSDAPWQLTLDTTTSKPVTWTMPAGVVVTQLAGILDDGSVVFRSYERSTGDRPIEVAQPDGGIRTLTITGAPEGAGDFTPWSVTPADVDGNVAVSFVLGNRSCLATVSAESGAMQVYSCRLGGGDPTFSPDGTQLAELRTIGTDDGGQQEDVLVIDAATLRLRARYSIDRPPSTAGTTWRASFADTLVWDGHAVLAPAYGAWSSDGHRTWHGSWTLVWLRPGRKPSYQVARSLAVPFGTTDLSPWTFGGDALDILR